MLEGNKKVTKAYSRRVRPSRLLGKKRTQGEYTDNYYQAVAKRTPVALASLLCFTALEHHRTTLPTATSGTAQTCHWHLWALPLAARRKPRAAACSNGLHRGADNPSVCGTVPLSGLVEARKHSWTAGHAKGVARAVLSTNGGMGERTAS